MKPHIVQGWGASDADWVQAERARRRVAAYEDLSTVIVMPTRGMIPARVVDSFMSMMRPPNSKATQLFMAGLEVGDAYNEAVGMILAHPDLCTWPYILTVEEDNLIPPTALLDLQREMIRGRWDVLGGLYWTKGDGGVPQIWGDPSDAEFNFRPVAPQAGKVVKANGTGMGCTLFRRDVFERIPAPWFETIADQRGLMTQDLAMFAHARRSNVKLKVGVDCRVKIGHLDSETGRVW